MRIGTLLLIAAAAGSVTACATAGNHPVQRYPTLQYGAVAVEVTNDYGLPMEVYASGAGVVYRLGTVLPGIVGHFELRQALLASGGTIELFARARGAGPTVRSGLVNPQPGDTVQFEIPALLRGTALGIRP